MRNLIAAVFMACVPLIPGVCHAQQCNSPSGWIQTQAPFTLGDLLVLNPDCNHVQDSGIAPSQVVTTPSFSAWTPSISCGTGTFNTITARYTQVGTIVFYYFTAKLNTAGTCTSTSHFTFTSPTIVSATSVAGSDWVGFDTTGLDEINCFPTNTSTIECTAAANFVAGAQWFVTGFYEQ